MAFENTLNKRLLNLKFRTGKNDELYTDSYPLFLEFFRRQIAIRSPAEENAKLGVFLVYSWMGRGKLKTPCLKNFGSAATALSKARSEKINVVELQNIMNFVSGSLVATSKYLHFLNPKCFAIWDSRVAWAGYRLNSNYQVEKPRIYLQYLEDLSELRLPDELFNRISNLIPGATEMRIKEFALFHLGIQEDVKNSSK